MTLPLSVSTSPIVTSRNATGLCIHEMFCRQAAATPNAVAVSCGEERLTYGELDSRSNQLARFLTRKGVGKEVPVALYLERSTTMVVAILGVLKAGGAYVPIDLAYPKERVQFILEDTSAPVLLTQAHLLPQVPPGVEPICLETSLSGFRDEATQSLGSTVTPSNAAYIIYTSGSTGKPKGVIVTHRNVVRLLEQTAPWYEFNNQDVWPLFHSYAFDVSVWELWGSLFNGGHLVIVPYLVSRSPAEFYKLLSAEGITVLNQTPSAFRQLIWAEQAAPERLPLKLRYVICAGEALELQSLKPWFELHGDEWPRIVNMYGITETTVHSTFRIIRQEDLSSGVGSVIGIPIPDLQIHLLDENLHPVPKGTPGEICVGGAGVARGYLNRPELNQQRFLPDPFAPEPGALLYRSGDLAVVNQHGEMEYLGRMDHQVKIRGFRVELGEIESAINRHPTIRESVVLAQDLAPGDKRLVAYIVPREGTSPTVSDLREHLAPKIPDYMIPAVFVSLAALPLNTNGKVDRRALPAPDNRRPDLRAPYAAPRNEIETGLASIWADVLGLGKVGIHDNFFELGGDSILTIRVLAKAQEKGWNLGLEQVFQNPTVAALAQAAQNMRPVSLLPATDPFSLLSEDDRRLLPEDAQDAYPVARLQLGMFYFNELDPASAMYHDVFSYRIKAPFRQDKLARALERLVARHPMLRTSFHLVGFSQPLQVVHRTASASFTFEDLSGLPQPDQDRLIADWVEAEKRKPFDRTIAPLCRFHVQARSEEEFQFFLSFHHCCLDGWSLAAVITEIFTDYSALLTGQGSDIPSPRASYRDFVALEQSTSTSESARKFWTDQLDAATPSLLPRWPKSLCAGGHEQKRGPELHVPGDVLDALKRLAQETGVPLKSVLLAGHLRVMSLLHGDTDVITGLVSNGRPEVVDGERIVGLFLNTIPLRQELKGGSWRELVRATFAVEQELMAHRRMPLSEIQKLRPGPPLFETAFDFVHFHVYKELEALRSLDLAEGHYFEANNLTTYTTLMLDVNSTDLEVHIDYDPNIITREQVGQITQYYLNAFAAMAEQPEDRYDRFSPLSDVERLKLLKEWNNTAREYPRHRTIHELIAEQARLHPEKHAVVAEAGDHRLTYAELEERAEAVACALKDAGAGPGKLVGVYMERSVDLIAGLLGILKTGAAYVPLDPAYPEERISFMLQDCEAATVLTERALQRQVPGVVHHVCMEDVNVASSTRHCTVSNPDNTDLLAYVIYTSGSTGKPKGVRVLHRGVVNLLLSAASSTCFCPNDHLLAVTTLSFDIAGLELWMPLVSGGSLTLAGRETAADGTRLAALIDSSRATFMQATPATWRLLIEAGWQGNPTLTALCGGEALKSTLADDLLSRAKAVWNFYGPTETTIWSTACRVLPGEQVTIGRPLANTQLYILDKQQQLLPVGAIGELHIGGDGLALGYHNRPELTVEKFISNPFGTGRLYKTGDLARYLPDGRVDCVGRVDQQVKVRGFRIELGEVESALRQHPGIADALITTKQDSLGENSLVGYVISRNGPPSTAELRNFLKSKLPLYMVPANFVLLKEFPVTPNGKVDMKRLPAPDGPLSPNADRVPPRTPEETRLAEIWKEVLMLKELGIDDNFFELGGDSLSATRAFARANRAFGMALTLREMLDRPTIRLLAELVATMQGTAIATCSARIPRQPRRVAA